VRGDKLVRPSPSLGPSGPDYAMYFDLQLVFSKAVVFLALAIHFPRQKYSYKPHLALASISIPAAVPDAAMHRPRARFRPSA
jgi:hypothetical protein